MHKKQHYVLLGAVLPTAILVVFLVRDLLSGGLSPIKPPTPADIPGGANSLVLIMLSAVALLVITGVILLYRRQVVVSNNSVPAQPAQIDITELRTALTEEAKADHQKSRELLEGAIKHATEQRTETLQAFKQLSEIVATLRKTVEEREQELKRYKQNHDAELYRKFLRSLIDIFESAQDAVAACPDKPEVAQVRELAEFLLGQCDVKTFSPTIGALYREEFGVADSPRYVSNSDPALARRIVKILHLGYELMGGASRQIVMPAKVEVFDDVKTAS